MSLLKTLAERYPLAVAVFVRWLTAKDTLFSYKPYIKQPLDKLPIEMTYGIYMLFFAEQGIMLGNTITNKGRFKLKVYVKQRLGNFRQSWTDHPRALDEKSMVLNVTNAFRIANMKLSKVVGDATPEEDTVLIGLDIDALCHQL